MTRGCPGPAVPRCGATTRHGTICQRPQAVRGGRCAPHAVPFVPAPRPERRCRINQRGAILCHNCKTYLPADRFRFVRYPSLPAPKYWSYCRDCTRALDRLRWCGERRQKNNASRLVRQRRQQHATKRARARFVVDAILILQRRGFTRSEIARLAGFSPTRVWAWERGRHCPATNVSRRLGVLLWETRGYALAELPAFRRRLPHPDLPLLHARMAPALTIYPLRDSWQHRRQERLAA